MPVVLCDARDATSVREVLITLVEHVREVLRRRAIMART